MKNDSIRAILKLDDTKQIYDPSEDNIARDAHVFDLLKEFYSIDQVKNTLEDLKNAFGTPNHTALAGPTDKIISFTEHALSLNNIKLNIVGATVGDSAIVVDPIKDKKFLRVPLIALVPELFKIPFTLYKKLGIRILSIC